MHRLIDTQEFLECLREYCLKHDDIAFFNDMACIFDENLLATECKLDDILQDKLFDIDVVEWIKQYIILREAVDKVNDICGSTLPVTTYIEEAMDKMRNKIEDNILNSVKLNETLALSLKNFEEKFDK